MIKITAGNYSIEVKFGLFLERKFYESRVFKVHVIRTVNLGVALVTLSVKL